MVYNVATLSRCLRDSSNSKTTAFIMYRCVQNNDKMCATVVVVGYKWVWVDYLERHNNYIDHLFSYILYNGLQLLIKYIETHQYREGETLQCLASDNKHYWVALSFCFIVITIALNINVISEEFQNIAENLIKRVNCAQRIRCTFKFWLEHDTTS